MSVYVDVLQDYGSVVKGQAALYGTVWCHMIADTEAELHAFALDIGLRRAWFQGPPKHAPHYDLTPGRRKLAVERGALELGRRDFMEKYKRIRRPRRQPIPRRQPVPR